MKTSLLEKIKKNQIEIATRSSILYFNYQNKLWIQKIGNLQIKKKKKGGE